MLSTESFVSQIFLVEKKEGGQRPVINLKCLKSFVKTKHFKMEGLHILPQENNWMIKIRFEGCIPSNSNSPREPTFPSVSMGTQSLPISVSPIQTDFSSPVFSKVMKPVVGTLRHMGIRLVIHLEDIHQGRRSGLSSFHFRSPRTSCQSHKGSVNSTTENGIPGVSGRYSDTATHTSFSSKPNCLQK